MTGISNATRELDVTKVAGGKDILFLSKTELDHNASFALQGFTSFYPDTLPDTKVKILALVVNKLVSFANVTPLSSFHHDVRLALNLVPMGSMAFGGVHQQWSSTEMYDLHLIHTPAATYASNYWRCVLVGDFHLDVARLRDNDYSMLKLANFHLTKMSAAGFSFIKPLSLTYFSFRRYSTPGGHLLQRQSTIDHIYHAGLNSSAVNFDGFAATDHHLVKVSLPALLSPPRMITTVKRNLKHLSRASLCSSTDIGRLAGSLLPDKVDNMHIHHCWRTG